jgi:hypothetical protein
MTAVRVGVPEMRRVGAATAVGVGLEAPEGQIDVWIRSADTALSDRVEAFVPAALLLAMRRSVPLVLSSPVSARMLDALPKIQQLLRRWYPVLSVVSVQAVAAESTASGKSVAAFFSGGADSLYTVRKHLPTLDRLIYVDGFDVALGDLALRKRVRGELVRASEAIGRPLVVVETNLRDLTERALPWDAAHGAALACVAIAIAPMVSKVLIPSSNPYEMLVPHGSHPLLDPMWSAGGVALEHDGCESSRPEKLASLGHWDPAMRSLRVCWENRGGAYNCGECEKCLRTMALLAAVQRLDAFDVFERSFKPTALDHVGPVNERVLLEYRKTLELSLQSASDPQLVAALRRLIQRSERAQMARALSDSCHSLRDVAAMAKALMRIMAALISTRAKHGPAG